MIHVNTHEAKTKLSYLLSKVELEHEKIKICKNDKPIALLVPLDEIKDPIQQNPKLMDVKINEDLTLPLSEDDWPEDLK